MTYVITPNSIQAPLNQVPQTLFLTQDIKDPIVQQNFEALNKILAKRLSGRSLEQANIVIGPAYSVTAYLGVTGTALQAPGALQVQIVTRGNPVRLKISPFNYSTAVPSYFEVLDVNSAPPFGSGGVTMNWGWKRNGKTICFSTTGPIVFDGTGGVQSLGLFFPLSSFEFDDVVPTGTYTYQFFYQLSNTTAQARIQNINVTAYELR